MFFSGHNHSHGSNFRLRDSIIKETKLIDKAIELGFKGVALTDHECISRHISFLQYIKDLKKQKEEFDNIKEPLSIDELKKKFKKYDLITKMDKDFKIGLGDEIYLVDSLIEVKDNYTSGITKFPHFILIAKDLEGHKILREISSQAWKNSFYTGKMERTPIEKQSIEEIIGNNKGHLIASNACLGGELAINIMNYLESNEKDKITYKRKIHQFITWCLNIFGEDFYLELQPSFGKEQIEVNKMLIRLSKSYNIKYIITTDTHYLNKEDSKIHSAYLNSSEGDREVDSFYATTYMMSIEEMWGYFEDYLTKDEFELALKNSLDIHSKIQNYDLFHSTIVPELKLGDFKLSHVFKEYYSTYDYINKFAKSQWEQDNYFLYLIEKGFIDKQQEFNEENLARIDVELEQLWKISEKLNQRLSAYYVLTEKIVEIMWDDDMGNSLVGVARGSVTGYYTAYLTDITQMNPIKWGLSYWRHISSSRPELPDVDIDSASNKRQGIFEACKDYFGHDNVINICTFKTEGSKSAVLTVCRGMSIDNDTAQYIADLIPFERGSNWSISECLYGNDENGRKPVKEFINEIEKYEGLKEGILAIEGLICGRSIHASGVYIFKNGYIEQNAIMKAPNGKLVTAWNMADSDYCGGLKMDCLTIEALDKIRATIDLLLKENVIKWQGSLRKTYNKYLHPDVLDYETKEMWEMIGKGEIIDLFQFSTQMGIEAGKKIAPTDLIQMASANSIMRLMSDGEEQPIDIYVKFKNDISLWYKEMREYGLSEEEISILEKHLRHLYGVADTQESIMLLSMDEKISGFTLQEANKLRKSVAKKKKELVEEVKNLFYKKGLEIGTRQIFLDYVWDVQVKRQLG